MGRWSIAWRVHDAQFWGVPQRRKRIALIADFGGLSAGEILFERKGLRWDPAESGEERQNPTRCSGGSSREAISFQERAGKPGGGKGILIQKEHVGALSTFNNQSVFCIEGHIVDRESAQNGLGVREGTSHTLNATDRHAVVSVLNDQGGSRMDVSEGVTGTLRSEDHGHSPIVMDTFHLNAGDICGALKARDYKDPPIVKSHSVYDARGNGDGRLSPTITGDHNNRVTDYTAIVAESWDGTQVSPTLTANNAGGNQRMPDKGNFNAVIGSVVRRLTPLECERLQGFPDGWTDIGEWTDTKGKKHKPSDAPRYKALGNSIALPFWFWLLRRISAQYERPAFLGSLFDGIGGFPLCWERCNGVGTALWASEIEEFPMAVTRRHFPDA